MRPGTVLSLAAAAVALLAGQGTAQPSHTKKVYISVDLEGIAGVVAGTQTSPGGQNYEWARRQMIAEANAAIEGAFAGGATEVLVNDSHGPQTNLRPDEIDRRATLITGQPKPLGMTQGLDSTFDAAVYIGYHAPGSTANAVQGHTFSSALKVVRLNGKEVGEYGLNAMVAGHWGVPVVFISGDKAAVEMAQDFIPGIDGLVVKEGIGTFAAKTMHPLEAREKIAAGVRAALVKRIARQPVRLGSSITLEVELDALAHADQVALVPGMQRRGRTVSYTSADPLTIYRVARVIMALSRD
ncbi:MAG TPA: M55 family metallopeptidase [Gemmatimonadaceae bacterium]|nr:M55 family metallopeptidase [Gemmatimonadaceae bacterium]